MKTKKILSVILAILFMFSFCSFSTYAADGSDPIDTSSMSITCEYYDGESWNDVTSNLTCKIYYNSSVFDGMYSVRVPIVNNDKSVIVMLTEPFSISEDHEYNLSFEWGYGHTCDYPPSFTVDLVFYDSEGNSLKEQNLVSQINKSQNVVHSVDIDFKADIGDISAGYKCQLRITFAQAANSTASEIYFLSNEISLIDKDDDSGWFQKIINKIEETINNIKQIPEKINQKLAELKNGIGEFFEGLGEDIKGFFEMLKNYLLYFQHPVTLNSEGVLVDENGEPIYTNPFESALSDVEETVNVWLADIKQFIEDIDESRIEVSGYMETGTGFINDIMSAHPIISACLIFAAAFFVIRKVVGR